MRLLLFLVVFVDCSAQSTFYKTYGTANDDVVLNLERCSDGGYYIIGRTNTSVYREDGFIVRTNPTGNILWEKIIQFDSAGVHLTGGGMLSDESVILIFREYTPFYEPVTYIMKLNPAGDTLWTKLIGTSDLCCIDDPLIPLSNGEFLLAGRHMFGMGGPYFGCVYRIDSAGNTMSLFRFTNNYDDVFLADYTLTPDSEIVSVGHFMEHIGTHPLHSFLIKCDLDGNFISGETYKDTTHVSLYEIIANQDQTYTLLCSDNKLLKTDTSGAIVLSRTNTGNDIASSIIHAPNSGYFICGGGFSFPGYLAGLSRTNESGDTVWTKKYLSWDIGSGIAINPVDKSIAFSSTTDTLTNSIGGYDGFLMTVDSTGSSICYTAEPYDINFQTSQNSIICFDSTYNFWTSGYMVNYHTFHQIAMLSGIVSDTVCSPTEISESISGTSFSITPNPLTQNSFQVSFAFSPKQDLNMELLSLEGKKIINWTLAKENIRTSGSFYLPENLANGIYFLKVMDLNYSKALKMIVIR